MYFSVRVIDEEGNPRKGISVMADFGFMNGTSTETTDDSGWAEFNTSGKYVSMDLYVDGSKRGNYSVSEGKTYSFTI